VCDISALKFACLLVIEAGAVPRIAALLSDVFDIRREVMLFKNVHAVSVFLQSVDSTKSVKAILSQLWYPKLC